MALEITCTQICTAATITVTATTVQGGTMILTNTTAPINIKTGLPVNIF